MEVGKGSCRKCGVREENVSIGTGKRRWCQEKDRPHNPEKGDRITHNVTKTDTALNPYIRTYKGRVHIKQINFLHQT